MNVRQVAAYLVRQSPRLYAVSLVLQLLRLSILVVPGLIIAALFDTLAPHNHALWGAWALGALLAATMAVRVATVLSAVATEYTLYFLGDALLRKAMLAGILRQPGAQALPASSGDMVSRLRDDVAALVEYLRFSVFVCGTGAGALVAVIVLLRVDVWITLVACMPLVLASVVANVVSRRLQRYRRGNRIAAGAVSGFLGEAFGTVQAIQVAGAEEAVIGHLQRLNASRRAAALRDILFSNLVLYAFLENAAEIGTGMVLLLVGRGLHAGTFTVGDLSLYVYLLPRIVDFTGLFGQNLAVGKQSAVSLDRLAALLQQPVGVTEDRPSLGLDFTATPGLVPLPENGRESAHAHLERLSLRGLSYGHRPSGSGVQQVSLDLERGSFTVLTGRIGAGKTTLLRVLLGLLPRDDGEILWNGTPIDDPASFFLPPRAAYAPQVPHLFADTIKNNILLGLPADEAAVQVALERAVLERDIAGLDRGLDTIVGPRGVRLSGGQVQRTAAARLFIRAAELIVFDDVSSALDVGSPGTELEFAL